MFFKFIATKNRFQIKFDTRSKKRQSTNRISSRFGLDFRGFWTTGIQQTALKSEVPKTSKTGCQKVDNRVPKDGVFSCRIVGFESTFGPLESLKKQVLQASYKKHKAICSTRQALQAARQILGSQSGAQIV